MKQLAARFKPGLGRSRNGGFRPFALKVVLGAAAVIYAVYTVVQITEFIIKDL